MVSKQTLIIALVALGLVAVFLFVSPQRDVPNPFEKGRPEITGLILPANFSISQAFSGSVAVKNSGGADKFGITVSSTNGAVTASPASYARTIAGRDEDVTAVVFTAGKAGADQLCVTVKAEGSGASANLCKLVMVG